MPNELKVGDLAPDFELPAGNAKRGKMSDLRGKVVVLYFYPKDFTPGCTTEACNFRDNFESFKSRGIEVIGVSTDSDTSHEKFRQKYELPFILAADKSTEISKKYNVLGGKTARRVTFIIDREGKISHIFNSVTPKDHAQQVLNKIQELGLAGN
jgi:peroxiredoxin Q/BCP